MILKKFSVRIVTRNNSGRHCWDIEAINLEDENFPHEANEETDRNQPQTELIEPNEISDQIWTQENCTKQIPTNTALPKCDTPLEVSFLINQIDIHYFFSKDKLLRSTRTIARSYISNFTGMFA